MPENRIWSHCCGKGIALLGAVIAQGKVEVHTNVVGTKKPRRFQTASENKKWKVFMRYLCIIFLFKFQVLLKKISYYVLKLWAELKRS